jgi:enoyl-CoA hydratase
MADSEGSITVEVRGHLLLMGFNRPEKYNGYTPHMSRQLVEAYTRLDEDPELRVGVVFGHGSHFCAGLDLPKWTDRFAREGQDLHDASAVDPLALGRACRK